jgi:hypothetical protein
VLLFADHHEEGGRLPVASIHVLPRRIRGAKRWLLALLLLWITCQPLGAQGSPADDVKPVPLLTGSAGFITTFDGGEPHLGPLVTPVVLIPLGQRWLFEARVNFESDLVQVPGQSGFHGSVEKSVDYAQLDFIANPYMTVTLGRFLTPFNIYNERLYPVWIRDLQTDPLILPIGVGPSNASNGAMIRGGSKLIPLSTSITLSIFRPLPAQSTSTPPASREAAREFSFLRRVSNSADLSSTLSKRGIPTPSVFMPFGSRSFCLSKSAPNMHDLSRAADTGVRRPIALVSFLTYKSSYAGPKL